MNSLHLDILLFASMVCMASITWFYGFNEYITDQNSSNLEFLIVISFGVFVAMIGTCHRIIHPQNWKTPRYPASHMAFERKGSA